jgi:multidrug efflux pump subunit AcrB
MIESFIDRLTNASVRFKWVTIGLAILALVAGIFALTELKQELIPSIEFPQTVVLAFNSGMVPSRTSKGWSTSNPRPRAVWLSS